MINHYHYSIIFILQNKVKGMKFMSCLIDDFVYEIAPRDEILFIEKAQNVSRLKTLLDEDYERTYSRNMFTKGEYGRADDFITWHTKRSHLISCKLDITDSMKRCSETQIRYIENFVKLNNKLWDWLENHKGFKNPECVKELPDRNHEVAIVRFAYSLSFGVSEYQIYRDSLSDVILEKANYWKKMLHNDLSYLYENENGEVIEWKCEEPFLSKKHVPYLLNRLLAYFS